VALRCHLVALLTRWGRENLKVLPSDHHDLWHASCGSYFDVLVTDDEAYRATLEGVESLPFAVSSPIVFAERLATGGPVDHFQGQ
jgi:hypothetical protein